ncbi:MAG: ergothioneine biosynthesis protein EgtB [Pyrinomonadaceae bacterium]
MQAASQEIVKAVDLKAFYQEVRSYTEHLCAPLAVEDYIPQPVVDVSPARWNVAHTTWFFEEMILKNFLPEYEVFDPDFGFLFNSYYNTLGERTPRDNRGALSRPTVAEVFAYRKYVDERMSELLSLTAVPSAMAGNDLGALVILGLNHEQQHQELLITDLKYTFSVNPLLPAYREGYAPEEISEPSDDGNLFAEVEGGVYEIGYDENGFSFDNELSRHKVYLNDFAISNRLTTNGEFLEFIDAGGYRDHSLWHSEGWDWVNQNGIDSPLYWHKRDGDWHHFTLGGLRPVPADAPVCHVSYYEAAAFAEWKGMHLPTEFEWEAANEQFAWGKRWEWTNSAYLPYPGFAKAAGAIGEYNGKFMINQMVLRGASVATPAGHSRPTYRNFFQPHLRWQFTGIRLAK